MPRHEEVRFPAFSQESHVAILFDTPPRARELHSSRHSRSQLPLEQLPRFVPSCLGDVVSPPRGFSSGLVLSEGSRASCTRTLVAPRLLSLSVDLTKKLSVSSAKAATSWAPRGLPWLSSTEPSGVVGEALTC